MSDEFNNKLSDLKLIIVAVVVGGGIYFWRIKWGKTAIHSCLTAEMNITTEKFSLESLIAYVDKLHLPLQVKITEERKLADQHF